jgi:hypothetical protein
MAISAFDGGLIDGPLDGWLKKRHLTAPEALPQRPHRLDPTPDELAGVTTSREYPHDSPPTTSWGPRAVSAERREVNSIPINTSAIDSRRLRRPVLVA